VSRPDPTAPADPPRLDDSHWIYRRAIFPFVRGLVRYHRMTVEGGPPPSGPCIYVGLHGAGYLVLDLVMACYFLQWKEFDERGAPHAPLRIVAAQSQIERFIPGLPRVKDFAGIIGTREEDCVAVLERGEQLLITPGGMREAQPSRDFYRLRWKGRHGFVRIALRTGVPIVPFAIVGGAEAYPGLRRGKLSFWSPVPLPAKLELAIGAPIPVARDPAHARDPAVVGPIHARAWKETQALLDRLVARRRPANAGARG
jgi:1-acyl-sn-glycerol-3-phosphate acyltransferase